MKTLSLNGVEIAVSGGIVRERILQMPEGAYERIIVESGFVVLSAAGYKLDAVRDNSFTGSC